MAAVPALDRSARNLLRAMAAGIGLMVARPDAAWTQQPAPVAADSTAADSARTRRPVQLQELTVTTRKSAVATTSSGLKSDALLIETPQAISVISSRQIEAQNAKTMQDVLRYSAGVRAEMYGLDNRGDWFTMRGGSEGSTVLDGLRLPLSGWYGNVRNEPYAFDRVEVLRGPASVLYGQNGPGGVVSLVSKLPLAEAHREIRIQGGNRNYKEAAIDLTGPLDANRKVLYRIVGLLKDADTQVRYADEERQYVAPSLTIRASDATAVTLYGQYQRDRSKNNVGFFQWEGMLLPAPHGQISDAVFIGEPDWDIYYGQRTRFGYQLTHQLGGSWALRQDVRHDRVTGKMRGMYANFWEGFADADSREVNRSWYASRTSTRITNTDLFVNGTIVLGKTTHNIYAGADAVWIRETNPDAGGDAPPLDVYDPEYGVFPLPDFDLSGGVYTRTRQYGLTLQDQIKIGSRLILLAGIRRDEARVDIDDAPDAGADLGAWTHRLGAVYRASGGFAPYVSYSTSFEVITGVDAANSPFKPKRGKQWEAGVKWMPEGRGVAVTASAYNLKEQNRLSPDPVDPLNQVQKGEVTVNGVELDATASVAALDLVGNYTFADATVTKSGDPTDPYLNKRLQGIPKHAASLWATHAFRVRSVRGFRIGAGVRYVGEAWDGMDQLATPSYTLMDGMFSFDTGRWRYAFNVTNLFDKRYFATCLDRGDCWYGSRRTLAVKAAFRY